MSLSQFEDEDQDEGGSYLVSVSDLMIGLLFVFLLMLMAFALQYSTAEQAQQAQIELQQQKTDSLQRQLDSLATRRRFVAEQLIAQIKLVQDTLSKAETERDQLLVSLRDRLQQEGVTVQIVPSSGILRLQNGVLFGTLSADLSDQPDPFRPGSLPPREVVRRLAAALAEAVPCYSVSTQPAANCPANSGPILEAIFIEGHTDNRNIAPGGPYPDNYALSTARALATYRALLSDQPSLTTLLNNSNEKLFGLSGYGPDRPVQTGTTDIEIAANRRIDIRFLLATPPPQELDQLRDSVARMTNQATP
jgi:flagellar motor protein MotB